MDMMPAHQSVKRVDLLEGIPLEDNVCDAVYHSHVLEHLGCEQGRKLMVECHRVLKPGGIARVAVPDLEQIARIYLRLLESALAGKKVEGYDWILLEMYDQVTRSTSGGEMRRHLATAGDDHREFIRQRLGMEAERTWADLDAISRAPTFFQRLRLATPRQLWRKLRIALSEGGLTILGGKSFGGAFREGLFRRSGEIHRSMYDRFSLARLLDSVGFEEPRVCRADESAIPAFSRYGLDMLGDRVRKPDSLFMEARKPGMLKVP